MRGSGGTNSKRKIVEISRRALVSATLFKKSGTETPMKTLSEFDLQVRDALLACNGVICRAADALGVKPAALYWNLKTQRQCEWWIKTKARLFSSEVKRKARSRRYYVLKRSRQAVEGLLSPDLMDPNGSGVE